MIHLFNGYYMAADKSSYTVGKAEESRSKRFFKPGARYYPSSHRKILHFSLFGVGRKRNGVTAENGTAPRDTLSRSLESKMRLRDTKPHKRMKIYYRLCTV